MDSGYVTGQSSLKSRSGLEVMNRNGGCRNGPFSTLRFSILFSFLRPSLFGHVITPILRSRRVQWPAAKATLEHTSLYS